MMARTTSCTPATIAGRRARAEQFLEAAELVDVLEDPDQDLAAAYVTLCVHAGIAASDVICCTRLGHHASGQDHTEAVRVLEAADQASSGSLDVLCGSRPRPATATSPSPAPTVSAPGVPRYPWSNGCAPCDHQPATLMSTADRQQPAALAGSSSGSMELLRLLAWGSPAHMTSPATTAASAVRPRD